MNRRALLSTVGVTALGGCAGLTVDPEPTSTGSPTDSPTATERTTDTEWTADDDPTPDETADLEYVWRYDVGGWIDGFADGKMYCREHWIDDDGDGRVVALDVESGERRWGYGFADGYEFYSDLLVEDSLYFGRGDDQMGGGVGEVYALDFDGSERWTYPETSSIDRRPVLVDGSLYAAGDAGEVRAFDADGGTVLWETGDLPAARSTDDGVLAVGDVVFVKMRQLFGLDPDDGSVIWSHGESDVRWGPRVAVGGDVAYFQGMDRDVVTAIASDGTQRWRRDLPVSGLYAAGDRVVVRSHGDRPGLYGLDPKSGEDLWRVDGFHGHVEAVTDGAAYAISENDDELRAYALANGTERWRSPVSDDPLSRVHVDPGRPLFVETEGDALHRVTVEGDVSASYDFEEPVVDVVAQDDVYVGTTGGIYRLPPG